MFIKWSLSGSLFHRFTLFELFLQFCVLLIMKKLVISNHSPWHILLIVAGLMLFLQSCYSVRISNVMGVPEPDPVNFESGFYRNKAVHVIDTTVNLSLLADQVLVLETCPEGCFQTVEYRVTLGAALLSGITFGKMRKIKVKYVCLKESN